MGIRDIDEVIFCASSAKAAQLTDDEFWTAVYCRTPRDDEADMEAAVEALNHETWMIHCARCGRFVEVDEDERIDRERDAFCDDCADEHHPDIEGDLDCRRIEWRYVANADHEAKDPDDLVAAAAPCIRWTLTEAGWRVA